MMIHIHQGGTVNAYCGRPLAVNSKTVGWEDAAKATCTECLLHFPQARTICTDCGGVYSTVDAALAHQERLAFPVSFIMVAVQEVGA